MFYLPCADHVLLFVDDVVTSWPQTKISDWSAIKCMWSLLYRIEHVLSQSVYHATSKSCMIQSNSTLYTVFLVYETSIMILALPCNRGFTESPKTWLSKFQSWVEINRYEDLNLIKHSLVPDVDLPWLDSLNPVNANQLYESVIRHFQTKQPTWVIEQTSWNRTMEVSDNLEQYISRWSNKLHGVELWK